MHRAARVPVLPLALAAGLLAGPVPPAFARVPWRACLLAFVGRQPPSGEWVDSPYIVRSPDGRPWFRLVTQEGESLLPVSRWSRAGNPVVRIPHGAVRFVPTQASLPRAAEYRESRASLERVTARDPIFAVQQLVRWPEWTLSRIVVYDGHHRYARARQTRSAVYVEIARVTAEPGFAPVPGGWAF